MPISAATLSAAALAQVSSLAGNLVLFTIVTGFIVAGLLDAVFGHRTRVFRI